MADNTLNSNFVDGDTVLAAHIKQLITTLNGALVPKLNNTPSGGQSLGTSLFPWSVAYINSIIANGQAIDFSQLSTALNRIISGKSRSLSSKSDFFEITDSLTFKILGATTNLVLSINGESVTYDSDIDITATGGIAGNNTCTVNDSDMTDDLYAGEIDYAYGSGKSGYISVDSMQQEIRNRIGEYVGFKYGTNGFFYGFIENETKISKIAREYFFDQSGNPLVTEEMSNDDTLTMLRTGFIFGDVDTLTVPEVSYFYPVIASSAPGSPETGQYWFNTTTGRWNRYSGSQFVEVNRIPLGIILIDGSEVVAYRTFDFSRNYTKINELELEVRNATTVGIKTPGRVEVGNNHYELQEFTWDISQHLFDASEDTEAYYTLLFAENLRPRISSRRPRWVPGKGFCDPFEEWKAVGRVYNDGSGDFSEERNYYISQKYNPDGKIDQEYSYAVTDGSESEQGVIYQSENIHPVKSISRQHSANSLTKHTFKDGFFF